MSDQAKSGHEVPTIALLDALRSIETEMRKRAKEQVDRIQIGLISGEYYRSCVARAEALSDSADAIKDAADSIASNNASVGSATAAGADTHHKLVGQNHSSGKEE